MRQTQHIGHVPAYFMRGEETVPSRTPSSLGLLVVAGKVGLFEVVQPLDTGTQSLRRNGACRVYAKVSLVDLARRTLQYVLGDDGIHDLSVYR